MPHEDMLFDGTSRTWYGVGHYRATSGLTDHPGDPDDHGFQEAQYQTRPNEGPIPEGEYYLVVKDSGTAAIVNLRASQLDTRQGVESLVNMRGPDGKLYESPAWGTNRVRLNTRHINNPRAAAAGAFTCTTPRKATRTGASRWRRDFSRACAS